MKKLTAAFIALAMATSVSACQSTGVTPQQQAQIGGALIGGLLGYGLGKCHKNKDAAIIGGLIVGQSQAILLVRSYLLRQNKHTLKR